MAPPQSSSPSLRDQQIASIDRILNLNSAELLPVDSDYSLDSTLSRLTHLLREDGTPIWKVLVFDDMGRNVISSVMHVPDLRKRGVTKHLHINHHRTPIPDVPVIYLVEPTSQNIDRICTDLSDKLYSPAYINFLQSVSRPMLEEFAQKIYQTNTAGHIAQVYDQYLNFIVSEPDLFSLGMGSGVYSTLNSSKLSDETLDGLIDQIVSGLFSVAVTMGSIPIIRSPNEGPAQLIAAQLYRKLRDHILNSKDNLFSSNRKQSDKLVSSQRPVMIIVDRNLDLVPMLSHSRIYQSLISDLLEMKLNSIVVHTPAENDSTKPTKKVYSVDPQDFFWAQNASNSFIQVAENIDQELNKYMAESSEVMKKTGVNSLDDLNKDAAASAMHLKAVLEQLPQLQERKATIDKHMNIATSLLNGIQARKIDKYCQLEEEVSKINKAQMLQYIRDPDGGSNPIDKLRLFIIWYLTTSEPLDNTDLGKFTAALKNIEADTSMLPYVEQMRQISSMSLSMATASTQTAQPSSNALFSSISSRLVDRFKDAGLGANMETLLSGFRNFLPTNKDFTLSKVVESIMEPHNASASVLAETEKYLYYDPRSANSSGILPEANQVRPGAVGTSRDGLSNRAADSGFSQKKQSFSEAIVFTVGGGSMDEYGNLQEWAKRKNGASAMGGVGVGVGVQTISGLQSSSGGMRKRVVYGSTELVSPEDFVTKELARLGAEISPPPPASGPKEK